MCHNKRNQFSFFGIYFADRFFAAVVSIIVTEKPLESIMPRIASNKHKPEGIYLDKETILEYFEREYRSLLKLAVMMVKDVDAAQDVLHNVAVVLLKKQYELEDVENYPAFLAVCIRRAALNYFRKNARYDVQDPDVLAEICVHPESYACYDYVEWVVSLEKCLTSFSPEMRKAFVEHYLDNMPIEIISERLGITANALSLRFMRMRETLAGDSPRMLRHLNIIALL